MSTQRKGAIVGFDYEKSKAKAHGTDFWAAYSDLFTMLAFVFLLMYVYAAVTSGTNSVQQQMEYQRLAHESEDLKQQIKVYNTLKQEYLEKDATDQEQKAYEELMGKLDLLQEKAKGEKEELRRQASENEKTEQALNKYQQMIRNIINTNILAKTRLDRKEKIIAEKGAEIENLEKTLDEKVRALDDGKQKIAAMEEDLDNKVKELKRSYKAQKISKEKMDKKIAELTEQTKFRVVELENQNQEISKKLFTMNKELDKTSSELAQRAAKVQELESQTKEYENKMESLRRANNEKLAQEKAQFEKELASQRMDAEARAKALREYNKKAQAKADALNAEVSKLQGQVDTSNRELDKARRLITARQELAKEIKQNFAAAGVDAEVDQKTGDVVLSFNDTYFDTGKAKLKPTMKETLQKFMPIYAGSLFGKSSTAEKIKSVEIVGFSSPTYQGKFVDPESLSENDRNAVNFNLDLSYQRAKSIFEYIFDTKNVTFKEQKRLLPLVKVTGRSFLAEGAKGRGIASGIDQVEYCKKNDCKKSQRVIIKFNLEE